MGISSVINAHLTWIWGLGLLALLGVGFWHLGKQVFHHFLIAAVSGVAGVTAFSGFLTRPVAVAPSGAVTNLGKLSIGRTVTTAAVQPVLNGTLMVVLLAVLIVVSVFLARRSREKMRAKLSELGVPLGGTPEDDDEEPVRKGPRRKGRR